MNFSYGVIVAVGILAAISIGFISMDPQSVIEPRVVSTNENPVACTMQWEPMCGADGVTYGNSCMLAASDAELDHEGECVAEVIIVNSHIMPKTATAGNILLIEVEFRDDDKKIIDHVNYDIFATQDEDTILSDPSSHRHPGMHPIHETSVLSESPFEIIVVLQGLGHGDEITEPKGIETMMTITPEAMVEPVVSVSPMTVAMPENHSVDTAEGSGAPGCEETDECFLPYSLDIKVGDTVTWNNIDTAAHTVTSGSVADGVDGLFDSSLFMSGTSFEFTFDETGTFDYFCMVHPWMVGQVVVNDVVVEDMEAVAEDMEAVELIELELEVISQPISESEKSPMIVSVSLPIGSGAPGCEETNECYIPYQVNIETGSTVSWVNDDSAAHTVTSGTVSAGLTGVFDSGIFMAGSTFDVTFDETGTFDYFCMVHPWMTGQVIVN